jgi:GMP synthase-like glutamine amidotransferase
MDPTILLIDNTLREEGRISPRIRRLEEIFRSYPADVRTVHFASLSNKDIEGIDAVVLSGSSLNVSEDATKERMEHVFDLIRSTDLPVLGICFGFHQVMHAYGCTVRRNDVSSEFQLPNGRIIEIEVTRDEGIVKRGRYQVNVAHRDYVDPRDPALKESFIVHALSRDDDHDYLQYASHIERPVHAVQFHPEAYIDAPIEVRETGIEILHGFLWHTLHI